MCLHELDDTALCYADAGWLDNEPSKVTGRLEVRPAAELGPIIVCLDTSGQPFTLLRLMLLCPLQLLLPLLLPLVLLLQLLPLLPLLLLLLLPLLLLLLLVLLLLQQLVLHFGCLCLVFICCLPVHG